MGRHMPWWAVLILGVACVVLGVVLTAEPFRSLSVLVLLVGLAMLLTGVGEIASAGASPRPWLARLVGVLWIVIGIVALAWPGITLWALAAAVGIALVVGGLAKVATALFGDREECFVLGVSGLTNVIVGVLALTWPDVTVLALAVLFGLRTIVFGISQIALALRMRREPDGAPALEAHRWPRSLRLIGTVAGLVLALGGAAISVAIQRAQPGEPGPFYTAPSPLPDGPPGTIIRREVIDDYYAGATTYRVLYLSTGYDGDPAAVSGIIVVPDNPAPPGGRQVLAYTHGTIGVAPRCAPSLQDATVTPLDLEGGERFIAAGYVIAASDYQGLGTRGPHPYLVGEAEGMNALDGVRAARNLAEADAGADFAVWGHSQGGHAALFTGQLAASYAPELRLLGVAAGGPVPNLIDLFKVNIETDVGKILIAMALHSWARVYDDATLDQIVTPAARPVVGRVAANCLYSQGQILGSLPSALLLNLTFLSLPPWEVEPWRTIAEENTPGATPIDAPLLIVQSDADTIIDPAVTERFVDDLCASGETVDLLLLSGLSHVETGHEAAPDVAAWIADRFTGGEAPTTCD